MNAENLTLGQKLKIAKERSEEENRRIENERKMREDEIARKEYNEIVEFFTILKEEIVKQIENDFDNVTFSTNDHKRNYDWFSIISGNHKRNNPNRAVKLRLQTNPILDMAYEDFKQWLDENELTHKVTFQHDGVGVKSWSLFVILPKDM